MFEFGVEAALEGAELRDREGGYVHCSDRKILAFWHLAYDGTN